MSGFASGVVNLLGATSTGFGAGGGGNGGGNGGGFGTSTLGEPPPPKHILLLHLLNNILHNRTLTSSIHN
jgi:hypothetical protein